MDRKGLCEIYIDDKNCRFSRVFPVIECEEFSVDIFRRGMVRNKNQRRR